VSSGTISPQYQLVVNTDGTGTLDIKDPILLRRIMQLMSGQISRTRLITMPQSLPSTLFQKLIDEINNVYSAGYYTSTWVCLRKLFENLLIELLRTKYGTSRIDLYYNESKRRFNDFSVLIKNLSDNVSEFQMYTLEFNNYFFNFLDNFREQANRTAHSIDIIEDHDKIDELSTSINHYCTLLCDVIRRIQTSSRIDV